MRPLLAFALRAPAISDVLQKSGNALLIFKILSSGKWKGGRKKEKGRKRGRQRRKEGEGKGAK